MNDKERNREEERFWKLFIDDIVAAMQGSEEDAQRFVDWMNTLCKGIEFTFEWSDTELTYLDVTLVMTN